MSSNLFVVMVTGASRGIGRETAGLLAQRHCSLALLARTAADLADETHLSGAAETLLLPVDVSDPAAVQGAVSRTVEHFGRLDAVVHCAGLAPSLSLEQTTMEDWRAVIDTNLSSAFYLAKAAWPYFKQQQGGVIVNISSEAARDPFPGFAAYASAKAGLNLLGKVLAKEGSAHHIRVHTIAPAAVETQMFRNLVSPEQWPAEKTLAPEDVAKVIVDCLHGSLRYTSGEVIWLHRTV